MTDQQGEEIIRLRGLDYGYKTIAGKLGIPVETVKSHCKRHNITKGVPPSDNSTLPMEHCCLQCGKPIIQDPKRKEKKYCSDACRNKWWNSHPELVKKKTGRIVICAKCGREFYVNMQSNRKYCSHACYINDRFYGDPAEKEERRRTSGTDIEIKPLRRKTREDKREITSEEVLMKDDNFPADSVLGKPPYLTKEEGYDLLGQMKKIKCKCRNCDREYEYRSGYGIRYCCAECFVNHHPGAYFDEMNFARQDGPRLTEEEFKGTFWYVIIQNQARKMVRHGYYTMKGYFELMIWMLEKLCPSDEFYLFLQVEISESTGENPIRHFLSWYR